MRARLFGLVLGIYLLVLFNLTLVQFRQPGVNPSYVNLRPLATISSDLYYGGREFWINFVGNIVVFAPLGVLLLGISRGRMPLRYIFWSGLCLSVLIEGLQYCVGGRVSDVDDVLLNTIGALGGAVLYRVVSRLADRSGYAVARRFQFRCTRPIIMAARKARLGRAVKPSRIS